MLPVLLYETKQITKVLQNVLTSDKTCDTI